MLVNVSFAIRLSGGTTCVSILYEHCVNKNIKQREYKKCRKNFICFFFYKFMLFSFHTPKNASLKIPGRIFELPLCRSTKVIGISLIPNLCFLMPYFMQIWKA